MPQVDIKIPHLTVQVAEQDLPEHWVAQVVWAFIVRQHKLLKWKWNYQIILSVFVVLIKDDILSLVLYYRYSSCNLAHGS